jgi:excisionase family DNA binding protein
MTLNAVHHSQSQPLLPERRLLTAQDVAERLGVSERWVRDHATRRHPKIPVVKLGPLLRFRQEDIEHFLNSHLSFITSKNVEDGV